MIITIIIINIIIIVIINTIIIIDHVCYDMIWRRINFCIIQAALFTLTYQIPLLIRSDLIGKSYKV